MGKMKRGERERERERERELLLLFKMVWSCLAECD